MVRDPRMRDNDLRSNYDKVEQPPQLHRWLYNTGSNVLTRQIMRDDHGGKVERDPLEVKNARRNYSRLQSARHGMHQNYGQDTYMDYINRANPSRYNPNSYAITQSQTGLTDAVIAREKAQNDEKLWFRRYTTQSRNFDWNMPGSFQAPEYLGYTHSNTGNGRPRTRAEICRGVKKGVRQRRYPRQF